MKPGHQQPRLLFVWILTSAELVNLHPRGAAASPFGRCCRRIYRLHKHRPAGLRLGHRGKEPRRRYTAQIDPGFLNLLDSALETTLPSTLSLLSNSAMCSPEETNMISEATKGSVDLFQNYSKVVESQSQRLPESFDGVAHTSVVSFVCLLRQDVVSQAGLALTAILLSWSSDGYEHRREPPHSPRLFILLR